MLLLVGCGRSVDSRLVSVNALCDSNDVDSAITVLRGVCRDSLDEHNQYYYDLMNIKTLDKSYQDITADTIITDIISYFERNGSEAELGEAYYYGGRVCREQGDAPQALDYFQKSLDALQSREYLYRKGKIASQMGQLFLELYMFEQAKPKFQEAIAYQTACGDSVGLMYNYSSLANTYDNLAILDSSIICYEKSINLAHNLFPNEIDEIESRIGFINFLINHKNYEQAVIEYKIVEPLLTKISITDYVKITSLNIYIILKDYEKVESLASELSKSSSLNCREFAYNALKELAEYRNDVKSLYYYTKKYNEILDSVNSMSSREAVVYKDSFYNYSLRERENLKLQAEQKSLYYIIMIIICSLVLLVISMLYLYQRNRSLKLELSLHLRNIDTFNQAQSKNTTIKYNGNNEAVSIDGMKEAIVEKLKLLTDGVSVQDYQVNNVVLKSEVYEKFRHKVEYHTSNITLMDWQELDVLVNNAHGEFKNKLYLLNSKLSEQEYKICLLIKCGFSNNHISEIMNKAYPTVISIQKRLYEKIFRQQGKASDFVKLIYSI